jgi:hypothetical protein
MAAVGNVNDDGHDDVVAGEPNRYVDGPDSGRAPECERDFVMNTPTR